MRRIPIILFGAFAAAALAILCFGDNGLSSYRELEKYKASLEENVDSLSVLNGSLSSELDALKNDPGRVEVMARDLGFFKDGENVLRLSRPASRGYSYQVGSLVKPAREKTGGSAWVKTSAAAAAAVVLVVLFIARGAHRRRHGHPGR